jgi:hypothetical protein
VLPSTMLYFKAPGRYLPAKSPAVAWGRFIAFIEVADDQHASRQVNVFRNGSLRRYDRAHGRDEYGYLTGLKFSRKEKWHRYFPGAEILTASEFESVWSDAC